MSLRDKDYMETMSLYESGDSTGVVSITDMLDNKNINKNTGEVKIRELATLLIRGGWKESLKVKKRKLSFNTKELYRLNIKCKTR